MAKKYQVRVRFSAIRTWTIEARNRREATDLAKSAAVGYFMYSGGTFRTENTDKMRVTSVAELTPVTT